MPLKVTSRHYNNKSIFWLQNYKYLNSFYDFDQCLQKIWPRLLICFSTSGEKTENKMALRSIQIGILCKLRWHWIPLVFYKCVLSWSCNSENIVIIRKCIENTFSKDLPFLKKSIVICDAKLKIIEKLTTLVKKTWKFACEFWRTLHY